VGGIQEKVLAARRAGIKTIVMSQLNRKDVNEMQVDYTKGLDFHFVSTADEVLQIALLKEKVKQPVNLSLEKPKVQSGKAKAE
jgi:ATP-dependent Lon protease